MYHKATTNDIYLSLLGKESIKDTSRPCITYICSDIALTEKEIDHQKKYFMKRIDYPKWIINKVFNEVEGKHKTSVHNVSEESQVSL